MPRQIKRYEHLEPALGDTSGLTERQCEIAELIAIGMTGREIAESLGVSVDTVNCHMGRLKDRFQAYNRTDLLCQMWMHGILQAKQSVRATHLF
ncbi:helix-turn-helix domain-containing protein, partial [Marinobacter nauticus]|uniref:helix-turn-helix domain-containing protein n=1 Tax=Marinobacter nauticus TaxID=2743 RepID=UPI001C4A54DF